MRIAKSSFFLCLIILMSFILPRLIPGSPLFLYDSDVHALNSVMSEETFVIFSDYYNVDKGIFDQFFTYLGQLMRLDFGYSFYFRAPVSDIILGRAKWTLLLSGISLCISSIIGICFGLNISIKQNMKREKKWMQFFTITQAFPVFIIAIIAQILFCFKLNIFPSSGAYTVGGLSKLNYAADIMKHLTLPVIVLVISSTPSIFILTYNLCSNIKNEGYIKLAYYNNVDIKLIKYKYILRNALPEILSKLNIHFIYLLSGTMFVEAIFSYPGMGTLLRLSALNNDYPLLQGILIVVGVYSIVINIIFEIVIKRISPRY
ncbi:ABC transporter permease [Brassicibacter mesophilus]|uniref:ABC transporter permease n=1 Tax=Brassicibacter mesophilus TaxID=745119 RepID=UPI003D2279BC